MGLNWRAPLAALVCALSLAACGPKLDGLEKGESGKAAEVRDGDTFVMEDGLVVHLAGVEAPRDADDTYAPKSRAALERLVQHRTVQLAYGGQKRVRDAAVAHVFAQTEGGRWVWVQQAMLLSGDARVHTRREQVARLDEMRNAENAARAVKRGLWAESQFAVRTAAALAKSTDEASADPLCAAERIALETARQEREARREAEKTAIKADVKQTAKATEESKAADDGPRPRAPRRMRDFMVVEGRVTDVAERESVVFLNFGADISRDFGVMLNGEAVEAWPGGVEALRGLKGQSVRVRGDVPRCSKPLMRVDHAAQIELLK